MEFMEISVSQGASQGKSFLARAFDLVHPGVAPPLRVRPPIGSAAVINSNWQLPNSNTNPNHKLTFQQLRTVKCNYLLAIKHNEFQK